jgi:hypothetical protein
MLISSVNATLISPINNTITTNLSNNFTANLSDNVGISNYTLSIYNSTSLINQTTVLTPTNPLTLTAGIVVTLVEGTYNWFYNLFDTSTNSFTSENYTLTISSSCSPTLNVDWIITDAQTCDATQVTTGTGSIIITTGNLTLKNGANVTSKSLNISITGDKVFIYRGSELRLS